MNEFIKIGDGLPDKGMDIIAICDRGDIHYVFRCVGSKWRSSINGDTVDIDVVEWKYIKK